MLSNTVPVEDTPHVVEALQWLDTNMDDESCLLAGNVFINWAKLSLDTRRTVIDYKGEKVVDGVNYALSLNFTSVYWVWWENGVGLHWYDQAVPETFSPVYSSGDIVVYQLEI